MKFITLSFALVLSTLVFGQRELTTMEHYMESITQSELKELVYLFASDEMEGREAGEPGQRRAAEFLKGYYQGLGLQSPEGLERPYFQTIPAGTFPQVKGRTENVLAYLEGTDKPDELLIITGHYDHIGMKGDKIYNGADDDASGNMAILEIAEAFVQAKEAGFGPRRSILFMHVTAEEKGLLGSRFYTDNPIFPLESTVANLNIDMIGRRDDSHKDNDNYIYLIGSDKLSLDLHNLSEQANAKTLNLELDYTFNDENDPNRFYYRSDHYNFAKNNIPIIFYFNGVHADYHQASDTADKIDYPLMTKRTKLIFATAWEIANREERIQLKK